MTKKQHRLATFTSTVLTVTGIVLLMIWAISLYNYGIWVDEHGDSGRGRPIDFVLSISGATLLCVSFLVLMIRRRSRRQS